MLNTITNIDRDSPARGKVKIGDELLSINGHGVEDVARLPLLVLRAEA